jgi:hypothetical protein
MNETDAYTALRSHLQGLGLDPHRIENGLGAGTPDVNYTVGMIEMKHLDHWPVRPDTLVLIPSFTKRKAQVPWLMRRWFSGGPSWVMLRVEGEYLLFAGLHARAVRAGQTREYLYHISCWRCTSLNTANWEALRDWLTWNADARMGPADLAKFFALRRADPSNDPTIID